MRQYMNVLDIFERLHNQIEDSAQPLTDVIALHVPRRWYSDECSCDEACEDIVTTSSGTYHSDTYELVCETCSGGDLESVDYDWTTPYPCPTVATAETAIQNLDNQNSAYHTIIDMLEELLAFHYDVEDGLGMYQYCNCGNKYPCDTVNIIDATLEEVTTQWDTSNMMR